MDTNPPSDNKKHWIMITLIIVIVVAVVIYLYTAYIKPSSKEGMTHAQRWGRSQRMLNTYNGLLPENRQQRGGSNKTIPMINPRGSIPVNYMLPNETGVQNVNAQATTIAAAGVDLKGLTTDTAALPAEDQRPVVENAQGVKDYTNVRSNPTVLNGLKLTSQDRPANYASRTVTQDGFRRQNQSRRFQIK